MISLLQELWLFTRERRKYVLAPLLLVLLMVGGLLVLAQGAAGPFIYALF
jgi:Family of unknown function (DUF5989)